MDQPPNGRRASLIPRLSRLPVPSSRTNRAAGELPRPAPPGTGGLTVAKRRTTGNQAPVSSSSGQNIDQALTAQPRATAQDEEDNAVELEENDSSAGGDAITSTQSTLVAEEDHAGGMNLDEVGPPVDQTGSRIRKPRPSLLERTVQTIAQIPPTPSPSRRKSSFYQSQSPMQGPSVPGEHASAVLDPEIKMVLTTAQAETGSPGPRMAPRGPPPAGLRGPSSSSGQRAPAFALPRSVSNPHRTGALQRTMSSGSTGPRNEASGKTAGGTMTRAQGKLAAGRLQNKPGASVTRPGAQKPRKGPQSVSSISVGAETDDDRDQRSDITQTSTAKAPSSNSGRTHQSSTISSSLKKRSDDPNSSPASAGKATKSSAALRESIAKAKAAQKKALQKPPVKLESGSAMSIDLPEAIFDPVLNLDAPTLELITSGQPSLRQRVEAARMSGRLNISAMGLRAIPDEVMNMYHPEQLDSSKGAWYESVDLVKLSAADNELETIDERVFPDVDPDMELDGTDEREYIFGGVEVLDLHRNRLQTLPAGLRFLRRLTSLHLVRSTFLDE
ncbi:MAG: hypothetical protein M1823_000195 [Watsoniomyces obsoletus]|nr:MAG: hypothetical protein M1823_000195 [Watsoniomyces obsoletus]